MSNWDSIKNEFQAYILKEEGGYVNHPQDPGGETNMGVTIGAFQSLAPTLLGIPGTSDNLKKLTKAQHLIILKQYYNNAKGDLFNNPAIAAYATELTWGSGQGGAKKMLRNAAATLGTTLSAGSITTADDVKKLNALNSAQLFDAITAARLKFYQSLATWPVFGNGWTKRINNFVAQFKKKVPTA